MVELEITTEPEEEPDTRKLISVQFESYSAEAVIRAERLGVVLEGRRGDAPGWYIDFGPVSPRFWA